MATRAQIIVKSSNIHTPEEWYYRHYDGDPACVLPDLERFLALGELTEDYEEDDAIQRPDIEYLYEVNTYDGTITHKKIR